MAEAMKQLVDSQGEGEDMVEFGEAVLEEEWFCELGIWYAYC
jgi:hypothetical protein